MLREDHYLLCLEGGGTRSQAALSDYTGKILYTSRSTDVNTNFVPLQEAQAAVLRVVSDVLHTTGISGSQIQHFASVLAGSKVGPELIGALLPNATYHTYTEGDVVFARAGIYRPHGVAVVSATGATAWGIRADDGRQMVAGGWGSLLGDEGSAYAVGLLGLRAAVRSYEGRLTTPTLLVKALCQHFDLTIDTFRPSLVHLAYQKPLSRAEIAGLAVIVSQLATEGDRVAIQILQKVANDLAALAHHIVRKLFNTQESFVVVAAGGLLNAGAIILTPLQDGLVQEFPHARLLIGKEEPAIALSRLMLYDLSHQP
ncbi:MAG: hypothetical protein JXA33_14070 [Anaerolineae bacterium]|nr:hypothetical protein [Anaerolineae bacterium]